MAIQEKDILELLNENYKKAIELLPPELAQEFQRKIIRPVDQKTYASSMYVAIQVRNETSMLQIQNWILDNFQIAGFGKKLAARGINPSQVYEQLLKGIFDYK